MEFRRVLTPARTVPDNRLIKIVVTYEDGELRINESNGRRILYGARRVLHSIDISPLKCVGADKVFCLIRYWDRWHMNFMQAGTPKQMDFLAKHEGFCLNGGYEEICRILDEAGLLVDDGHKYGTEWLSEAVPDEVLKFLFTFEPGTGSSWDDILMDRRLDSDSDSIPEDQLLQIISI